MFVYIFSIFGIISILYIVGFLGFTYGQNKGSELANIQLKSKISSPFDQIISQGKDGMEIINKFISVEFNKFLHSKMQLLIEEKGNACFTNFLNEMKNGDAFILFVTGFVSIIEERMSDNLKCFFNKYYLVLDENGDFNLTFRAYLTEWTNEKIRSIQAQMVVPGTNGIMNTEEIIALNNRLFIQLEYEVYKDFGIVSLEEKPKEIKNSLGGN